MLDAIGEIIPLAVAAGVAIGPLIAVIALLGTRGGAAKAITIWIAWFLTELALVLAAAAAASAGTSPRTRDRAES